MIEDAEGNETFRPKADAVKEELKLNHSPTITEALPPQVEISQSQHANIDKLVLERPSNASIEDRFSNLLNRYDTTGNSVIETENSRVSLAR